MEPYFPSAMRPKQADPTQMRPAIDCIPTPSCVMGGGNGAKKDLEDAARNHSLTARQRTILELLSRGDTNKAIARRLGMREGTFKAHVRQIMHKFGVTNRTQLAVVCANGRPSQDGGGHQLNFEVPGRQGGHPIATVLSRVSNSPV
jgi:DNA-binding NarL/FixJ family response regulator